MSCIRHGRAVVRGLPPRWDTRCGFCGHRLPVGGIPPKQTRDMRMRHWLPELVSRYVARHAAWEILTEAQWSYMMFGIRHEEGT